MNPYELAMKMYFVVVDNGKPSFEGLLAVAKQLYPPEGDRAPLTATQLVCTFDAREWVHAFVQGNRSFDRETLLGWFANALQCGYDEHARRAQQWRPRFAALPTYIEEIDHYVWLRYYYVSDGGDRRVTQP